MWKDLSAEVAEMFSQCEGPLVQRPGLGLGLRVYTVGAPSHHTEIQWAESDTGYWRRVYADRVRNQGKESVQDYQRRWIASQGPDYWAKVYQRRLEMHGGEIYLARKREEKRLRLGLERGDRPKMTHKLTRDQRQWALTCDQDAKTTAAALGVSATYIRRLRAAAKAQSSSST